MSSVARRSGLPMRVRLYIVTVAVAAVALLPLSRHVAGAITGPTALLEAAILGVLLAVTKRRPVQIAQKRRVDVATAPGVAAVVLLPGPLAVLAVVAGTLVGQLQRRPKSLEALFQPLFTTSLSLLRTLAG
ncbi:MAG: hypothetical protein ACR2PL_18715, partial [Dehalococcoidia bacterium]